MSLKGKIVIVTGSSRGIGFSIAREFSENKGAIVIICSRNKERAVKASKEISGNVFPYVLDVTNDKSIEKFIELILSKFKRIDVLVNNAGFPFDTNIWYTNLHKVSDTDFHKILNVDLLGSIRMTKAVIPIMLKNHHSSKEKNIPDIIKSDIKVYDKKRNGDGVIINIASTPAISGHNVGFPYTIAKAGLISLTKCIAKEYSSNNIRSYSLALGNIATDATYNSMTKRDRKYSALESPMKRWGYPSEVAKVASSLADCNFSFATGNTIVIDGGIDLL